MQPASQPDFYALLAQKISEITDDPGQTRQVIYEAARAALRKQVFRQRPQLSSAEIRAHLTALEEAIARIEEGAAKGGIRRLPGNEAHSEATAVATPVEERSDVARVERPHGVILPPTGEAEAWYGGSGMPQVWPPAFGPVGPDLRYWPPGAPPRPSLGRRLASGFLFMVQLAMASAAGVAIFALASGHLQLPLVAMHGTSQSPQSKEEVAPASTVAISAPQEEAPDPKLPTMYGVYAVSGEHLIPLEHVTASPVDPRTKQTLQITQPAGLIMPDGHVAFIAFRRDLVTSAPDRVKVRIAAKIASLMSFDGTGKVVVAPPDQDTWLIRDVGYDFRVSPMRQSREMISIKPEDPDFILPPGRYVIALNGEFYDFAIPGTIADARQCVESTATARGPIFYECKKK
jgi:hypothetical protein